MDDQLAYTIIRGKVFLLMRQEILKAIPIPDALEEEPSVSDRENDTPTIAAALRELCANLSDHLFNTSL